MSDSFPAGAVPLSILAGVLWVVQPAALFPLFEALFGDGSLGVGFIFSVIFGHGGRNFLLSILTISILWMVFRDPKSLREFDRTIQVAAITGVAFLLLISPVSEVFYNEIPLVLRSIRVAGSICAAVLIGSVLVSKLRSVRSRSASA